MYPPNYSAKDTAITQRPPSSALLCIDAADRFKTVAESRLDDSAGSEPYNASAYDFTINKRESIMNGFFTRVGVSEVVFPWIIPNVNGTNNSITFTYSVGGVAAASVRTLDTGFYTPAALAARLQAIIRAIDPPNLGAFTMTYGVQTLGVSATVNRPIFEFKTNAAGVDVAFSPISPAEPQRKQLFDLLGFSLVNQTLIDEGFGTDTFCQATRYVDIVCSAITNNQALKDTMTQVIARDALCRVYVGDSAGVQSTIQPSSATFCPPGCAPTTIYKNFSVPKYIQWLPNQPVPGSLRFEVFDDAGFNLGLMAQDGVGVGQDWSMTMLVSEN